jgi:hypothetical protein
MDARKLYTSAVAALGKVRQAEEDAAIARVESARLLYQKARVALLDHEWQHHCWLRQDPN